MTEPTHRIVGTEPNLRVEAIKMGAPSPSGTYETRAAAVTAIEAAGGTPAPATTTAGRRRTLKAKTLRRMLKKKGLKTTGKKSTLMKRLKMKGGMLTGMAPFIGGETQKGGRRRRRSGKFLGMY